MYFKLIYNCIIFLYVVSAKLVSQNIQPDQLQSLINQSGLSVTQLQELVRSQGLDQSIIMSKDTLPNYQTLPGENINEDKIKSDIQKTISLDPVINIINEKNSDEN